MPTDLTAGFDPVRLAERVESEVTRVRAGLVERRYWRFRASRHYGGNNAGDVVGCNLRCAFCWAWRFAFSTRVGKFHSPQEAARRITRAGPYRVARLTGGEPTIGWEHTRVLAELLVRQGYMFILETNGILIGAGVIDVSSIPQGVHVRVSIKGADPESFSRATGARDDAFWLQLRALESLLEAGLKPGRDFHAAIVLGLAPKEAYSRLLERLAEIDPTIVETLEPEVVVLYPHVKELVRRRGLRLYLYEEPRGE